MNTVTVMEYAPEITIVVLLGACTLIIAASLICWIALSRDKHDS